MDEKWLKGEVIELMDPNSASTQPAPVCHEFLGCQLRFPKCQLDGLLHASGGGKICQGNPLKNCEWSSHVVLIQINIELKLMNTNNMCITRHFHHFSSLNRLTLW